MRYAFADCVLDTTLATLHRAGRAMPLRPKVFHLLQYLLEQRAHLVTKDALCAQVWPGQFISDATLDGCLKLARQAIGDSGRTQRLIQTRRGYGYRFVGAVEEQPVGAAPGRPEPALPPGEPEALPAGAVAATPTLPATGAVYGERKLVTLLGCTLVHAVALRTHLELDALHSQMRTLYTLAQREIQQYSGTLYQVTGDRFLAVFGVPLAHEDHARRAVLAALGLLQRLVERREVGGGASGEPLTVCLGLHTGLLIVGGLGEAQEHGAAVVGDLTLVVEVLQAHAAPGTLLCSDATARLGRGDVHLEASRPVPVPGQPTPLLAYRVLGVYPRDVPAGRRMGRAESPFVGRTQALVTLHTLLAQVEAGRGQVVGIVGEPGIGKSRLLAEFSRGLQGRPRRYLHGRCLSYGQATPYLPVLDLLRHFCDLTAADGPDDIPAKLHHRLQAVGMAAEMATPYLLALLGVETGTDGLAELAPEVRKARTFATLVQCYLQDSQAGPLILEIEDLHWSDAISEEWLTALVERVGPVPLLVLGTYRPGYRPAWLDKSYATQVALQPLALHDSRRVVQAILPMTERPAALEQAILAKADGNPFFLEELAQTVVEQGRHPLALGVPDTVQAVLAARIDRLPSAEKHLLQTAAVIGTEVPVPLLRAVAALPEEVLHHGLTHLQATEFLYETCLTPEQSYTFKHALTHEVAYGSLLLERRRTLHTRIVETLEALAGDRVAEQVERLAHHTQRGEMWDKALAYCRQVGEKALAQSAYREAVGYFQQALGALPHLPETRHMREQAIDLRLALRTALLPSGNAERILLYLREAESFTEALDDPHRLGQVSVFLTYHFALVGMYGQAIAAGQRALATADRNGVLQALAYHNLGVVYQGQGDYRRARDCFGQTVACLDRAQWHERFGQVILPAVSSRANLAACHAELGTFAEGSALVEEGLHIAEEVAHPSSLMYALWGLGRLCLRQGDLPRALPLLERALGICQEVDISIWFSWMAAALGEAYTLSGCSAEAVPLLTQAMGQERGHFKTLCCLPLGEAYMLAGRLEDAYALSEHALVRTREHQQRGTQAYALRLLGAIAAHRDPPDSALAAAHYWQALALAEELDMRPLQAHCHLGLGTMYAAIGQRKQARVALSAAIALYRAMGMTFWLPQAEAVLAQVEVQT